MGARGLGLFGGFLEALTLGLLGEACCKSFYDGFMVHGIQGSRGSGFRGIRIRTPWFGIHRSVAMGGGGSE